MGKGEDPDDSVGNAPVCFDHDGKEVQAAAGETDQEPEEESEDDQESAGGRQHVIIRIGDYAVLIPRELLDSIPRDRLEMMLTERFLSERLRSLEESVPAGTPSNAGYPTGEPDQ